MRIGIATRSFVLPSLPALPSLLLALVVCGAAWAGDGRIEINHARALAGGVTGSDTAGYPVTIDASGSYLLTGNLTIAVLGTDGIVITAPDVTLDLNGFTIAGQVTCTGLGSTLDCGAGAAGTGVDSTGEGTIVRNGNVRGFSDGIDMDNGCRVEDVTVVENRSVGLRLEDDCLVVGVVASRNDASGILGSSAEAVVVRESYARGNGSGGIRVWTNSSVEACVAWENGDDGIEMSSTAVAAYNASTGNGGDGISALGSTLLQGNAVYGNGAWGLYMTTFSGYLQNSSSGNTSGNFSSGVALGSNQP